MERISTAGAYQSSLLNILSAQNRQAQAQAQLSSGFKATDLKGFGAQADALTAMNSLKSRLETHVENATSLAGVLSVQDQAMGQVAGAATGARQAVADALAAGDASGLMSALEGRLNQAADALNTRFQGRYLFAGGQSQTRPLAADDLADLTAAPTTAALFANDGLKITSRLDDNLTAQTGVLANELGGPLMDALKAVKALDAGPLGPLSGRLTDAQADALQGALTAFNTAFDTANEATARNGAVQNRVDGAITSMRDRLTALEGVIASVAEVDGAEAATRLQLAGVALQASAQVFAALNNSALLNVLSR